MNKKLLKIVVSDRTIPMTNPRTNESLRTVEARGKDVSQGGRPSVVIVPERRRRYSSQEKMELVRLTYLPGNTISSVARAHWVAPSMLFRWRAPDKQGTLTAIQTGEGTVFGKEI